MEHVNKTKTEWGICTLWMDADRYYLIPPPPWDRPRANPSGEWGHIRELIANLKKRRGDGDYRQAVCFPGEYHPRVWRGTESPAPEDTGHRQALIDSLLVCHQMVGQLREVFYCVHPDISQLSVFGNRQRELLLLSCTEIESAWRSIFRENQSDPAAALGRLTTNDYVKTKEPMRLDEWSVELAYFPHLGTLTPFSGWDYQAPTASLPWYHAYNSVKHDREGSLNQATLGQVLDATAALYIMVAAQFGPPFISETTISVNDFRIVHYPDWPLDKYYTRPMNGFGSMSDQPLGYQKWTAKPLGL